MRWFPWRKTDPKDVQGLADARRREVESRTLAAQLHRHLIDNGFGRAFDVALHIPPTARVHKKRGH